MTVKPATSAHPALSPEAALDSLFLPLGVDGVYGRTERFEAVVEALGAFISRQRDPRAEVVRFPPVVSRALIEKSGYFKSFPHLLGCVCTLEGTEWDITNAVDAIVAGSPWTDALATSDLVLAPAACYPVYPLAARRGPVPERGFLFDVASDCFRREPSREIDRLQSFRMREFVMIGTPKEVTAFRATWMERAAAMTDALALPRRIATASDPFFGRSGKLMGRAQAEDELKFELLVPVRSAETPTACVSFNYHRDHFGRTWDIRATDGAFAHTACIAFGIDRLAVAVFATHGLEPSRWPTGVRAALALQK